MEPIGYGISLLLTDINIHSDTQAEPRKLSSLTLYIDFWQQGKPAPGQNPPVISPPMVIFRRIGVRTEIRTQNPVLSNTSIQHEASQDGTTKPSPPTGGKNVRCVGKDASEVLPFPSFHRLRH
jgi:hypothetical protein